MRYCCLNVLIIYMSWNSSKLSEIVCEIRFRLIMTIATDTDISMTTFIIIITSIFARCTITIQVSYLRNRNDKYSYEDLKLKYILWVVKAESIIIYLTKILNYLCDERLYNLPKRSYNKTYFLYSISSYYSNNEDFKVKNVNAR